MGNQRTCLGTVVWLQLFINENATPNISVKDATIPHWLPHADCCPIPKNTDSIYIFHLFKLRSLPALLCFKTIHFIMPLPWQCGEEFCGLIRLHCQNVCVCARAREMKKYLIIVRKWLLDFICNIKYVLYLFQCSFMPCSAHTHTFRLYE